MSAKIPKTKKIVKQKEIKKVALKERYFEGIGRRKTAVARVRLWAGNSVPSLGKADVVVNDKPFDKYFSLKREQQIVCAPFDLLKAHFRTTVRARGGGLNAQAEAIRLGIARAFIRRDPKWRLQLKAAGFLKRDPRMVERKKYGSRKARRPQQWRKR